jgi:predicted component of type VI protein secretion system
MNEKVAKLFRKVSERLEDQKDLAALWTKASHKDRFKIRKNLEQLLKTRRPA